jgi:peptidoglycan-associated lipoprotein
MKGTFSWTRAALVLFIAAVMVGGCAKKQTVKSDGGAAAAAPGAGEVKEAPVTEAPVAPPMAMAPAPAEPGVAVTEETPSQFDDVRFDFDRAVVREDGRKTCQAVAAYMKKNPNAMLLVEGHCDERGTAEYNLALGERRAVAVVNYLVSLGVPMERLSTISFGEERPLDPGHDEGAWARNRRAHFVLK